MRKTVAVKARKIKMEQNQEFFAAIKDIIKHPVVIKMKEYPHHYRTNCYQHCLNVAYANFVICKSFGLNAKAAARAGMIHDLFLYDWHTHSKETGNHFHGLTHPRHALRIAEKYFTLTPLEKDIILHHMWPITVTVPKSPEALITTFTDKACGLCECGDFYFEKLLPKRPYPVKWLWTNFQNIQL